MSKKSVRTPFQELKEHYQLTSPKQIKDRIIWNHLKAITRQLFGDGPENSTRLRKYEQQWILCEQEENKKGAG
jgi:hypothetical protein